MGLRARLGGHVLYHSAARSVDHELACLARRDSSLARKEAVYEGMTRGQRRTAQSAAVVGDRCL